MPRDTASPVHSVHFKRQWETLELQRTAKEQQREFEATLQTTSTRLRYAADFVEKIPVAEFDFRTWWCGTVGCAVGHMANARMFGMSLCGDPLYDVRRAFGITERQALWLFHPDYYVRVWLAFKVQPHDVAVRMRKLANQYARLAALHKG